MRKYLWAVFHFAMPLPPRYGKASPGYDRFCGVCIYYDKGHCKLYDVSVGRDYVCLACVRDYAISSAQASSMLSG